MRSNEQEVVCSNCGNKFSVMFLFDDTGNFLDCSACTKCGQKNFETRIKVGDPKKWIGISGTNG